MRRSLFSPLWYRVAGQHPRLNTGVRVERRRYRDETWFLLIDAAGQHFRVNENAYHFIGRCDGARTVKDVWHSLFDLLRDGAPTQDEVVGLLGQLNERGLIVTEAVPDAESLVERAERRRRERRRGFTNPFAFRIPLGDPWPWLKHLNGLGAVLFHPITAAIWIAVVVAACMTAAASWDQLRAHGATYLATNPYLFLTWLTFPFIKALHELCHALAVQRWGGEVHEAGVTLFVLVPAPYVDASQSTGFRARYQRALVSAAGIMCEAFIAACALFVWLAVEPGTIRNIAFVTMVTASVSTLIFNGNPLVRFDAYYVLCDVLDTPNLARRSAVWWHEQLRRLVPGTDAGVCSPVAKGEAKWLALYAPLSAVYRVLICILIVLWAGAISTVLGVLSLVFLGVGVVVKPLAAACGRLIEATAPGAPRWKARAALASVAAVLAAMVCLVPLPLHTAAPGVVWLPEQAQVRPETDGFVTAVLARDGAPVHSGMVLLRLEDPALYASRAQLTQRLEELQAERFDALRNRDLVRGQHADEDIARARGELDRVLERIAQLEVRSGADGTLVLPRQQDLPGSFAKRGASIAYVLNRDDVLVRAALREEDAALVRERTRRIDVRIAGVTHEQLTAELVRDVPAATRELPSAALGERGGGPFAIDPEDKDGLKTVEPLVLVDLRLPGTALERVGSRAWVRFELGSEPLAGQLYRRARQLLLRHFNPAA